MTRHARGAVHLIDAEGDLSELPRHESDRLDGVLALDRISGIRTIVSQTECEARDQTCSAYASPCGAPESP